TGLAWSTGPGAFDYARSSQEFAWNAVPAAGTTITTPALAANTPVYVTTSFGPRLNQFDALEMTRYLPPKQFLTGPPAVGSISPIPEVPLSNFARVFPGTSANNVRVGFGFTHQVTELGNFMDYPIRILVGNVCAVP